MVLAEGRHRTKYPFRDGASEVEKRVEEYEMAVSFRMVAPLFAFAGRICVHAHIDTPTRPG
jgi:hypothetical protein